ncbi:helix-turn-helix domain-containing protein [Polycladidibacter stylochi]|uniref:helix-turn-helix domain-containing protein n=1 Tax=Polycladidibacter stylochi TaxID=1807766 RepID=UPI000830E4A5|nr:helix-turn-helix domain-containing protein [Pseudovibrio stylochi]
MEAFKLKSPSEVTLEIGARLKRRRIRENLTQRELAAKSGVSYSSLRLMENEGKGALEAFLLVAFVLDADHEFDMLFPTPEPSSIEEVVENSERKRVRK